MRALSFRMLAADPEPHGRLSRFFAWSRALGSRPASPRTVEESTVESDARLREIVDVHFTFVWRQLRSFGVYECDLDDAAQEVFLVVAKRLSSIDLGREKAFVFSTAMRVASHARRTRRRQREVPDDGAALSRLDPAASPEEEASLNLARRKLGLILAAMPEDLRSVFVLFELEELSSPAIAELLAIPLGTVASRLRRARALFQELTLPYSERSRATSPTADGEDL